MLTSSTPADRAPSLVRAGAAVGIAMAAANALQYGLQLVAGHRLSTGDFGGFGALLGLGVVGSVPMLAMQTVAARHVAMLPRDVERSRHVGALLGTGRRAGLGVTTLAAVAAPAVAVFLHVPVAAALWLAVSLGPLAYVGAAQGVLQGGQRFGALARLFLAVSALRVLGPVCGLILDPHLTAGLAGAALGSLLSLPLAWRAGRYEGASGPAGPFTLELAQAANGVLALLALTGVDLLVARHVLTADGSGKYAAGALVARACFWLPQFVAVLAVPRLASGDAGLVRRAALVIGALGAVEVIGAALVPSAGVAFVLGASYSSLTGVLALFAAQGTCLAVLQLLLYADIARAGSAVGRLLWGSVGIELLLLLLVKPQLEVLISTALLLSAGTTVFAYALVQRRETLEPV